MPRRLNPSPRGSLQSVPDTDRAVHSLAPCIKVGQFCSAVHIPEVPWDQVEVIRHLLKSRLCLGGSSACSPSFASYRFLLRVLPQ